MTAVAIGVDVGSTTCKAVVVDSHGAILARAIEPTHPRIEEQTTRVIAALCDRIDQAGLAGPGGARALPVGATGYGRKRVAAARALTEITCHARGAFHAVKRAGILVDMGGQDTKVIRIAAGGDVKDFAMNDKCAAGTGRFLEVILGRLQVDLPEIATLVSRATRAVPVSSTCTVFAESEVISLVAQGEPVEGIVKGLLASLASRVASLAGAIPPGSEVFMSGGVAQNEAMVDALRGALGANIRVLGEPQLVGALGAALSARPA